MLVAVTRVPRCFLVANPNYQNRLKWLNWLIIRKVTFWSFFLSLSLFFFVCFFLSPIHSFGRSFIHAYFLVLSCPDRENTNLIDKYSLLTERVEATITVSGHTARKTNYQWGGYSSMDLAVDEQGLWLLWASTGNSGKLYASKIDVFKNVITQTWTLHTGKHIIYSPLWTPKQRLSGK